MQLEASNSFDQCTCIELKKSEHNDVALFQRFGISVYSYFVTAAESGADKIPIRLLTLTMLDWFKIS